MSFQTRDYTLWLDTLRLTSKDEKLLKDLGLDAQALFTESETSIAMQLAPYPKLCDRILTYRNKDYLEQHLQILERLGIRAYVVEDEGYPEELRMIEEPPRVLYVRGAYNPTTMMKNSISIVGARKHTAYGTWVCKEIVRALAGQDVTIVSGLALGIDGIAHQAALDAGLRTFAVLGNGLDRIYPATHEQLGKRVEEAGALLSEYPPYVPPKPYHFPQRNRLISALTKATVIVEAQEQSGSLITGRLAAEQGKEVFAVPGNIDSLYSRGTNRLILDGAIPLLDMNQLTDLFESQKEVNEKPNLEKYDTLEKHILEMVWSGAKTTEELIRNLEYPTSEVMAKLTLLEIMGLIEDVGNGVFRFRLQ